MQKIVVVIILLMCVSFANESLGPSIDFEFIPGDIYAGEASTGVFTISNSKGARPIFNLNLSFWAPCGNEAYPDWEPITTWSIDRQDWKDTRVFFSGALDERIVDSTTPYNNPYLQCSYYFNFISPKYINDFHGPAMIKSGEIITIEFVLQSLPNARPGTYDFSFDSEYANPGRQLASIMKR